MTLIDSNVWIYFLDERLPEHHAVAQALPEVLEREPPLVPAIVQLEVVHYLVRRLGDAAGERVDTFLALPADVESLTPAIAAEASQLLVRRSATGIGGRDAALLVTALNRRARLVTADRALTTVATELGVSTWNPVA